MPILFGKTVKKSAPNVKPPITHLKASAISKQLCLVVKLIQEPTIAPSKSTAQHVNQLTTLMEANATLKLRTVRRIPSLMVSLVAQTRFERKKEICMMPMHL